MPQPIILPPKPRKTGLLEPALKSLTQLGQMYAQGLIKQKLAEKNAATDYDYEGEGAERVFVIRDKKGNLIQARPMPEITIPEPQKPSADYNTYYDESGIPHTIDTTTEAPKENWSEHKPTPKAKAASPNYKTFYDTDGTAQTINVNTTAPDVSWSEDKPSPTGVTKPTLKEGKNPTTGKIEYFFMDKKNNPQWIGVEPNKLDAARSRALQLIMGDLMSSVKFSKMPIEERKAFIKSMASFFETEAPDEQPTPQDDPLGLL